MSGRKIYSAELKLEIMERYLKGDIGLKKLAEEYHKEILDSKNWHRNIVSAIVMFKSGGMHIRSMV